MKRAQNAKLYFQGQSGGSGNGNIGQGHMSCDAFYYAKNWNSCAAVSSCPTHLQV